MAPTEVEFNGDTYRRYPGSPDKSKQRYYVRTTGRGFKTLHRAVWEFHRGAIPDEHHIHHIDGDWFNNDIENLECVCQKTHAQRHATGECDAQTREHLARIRPLATQWHQSDEGRQWHQEHGKRTWEQREPQYPCRCSECGEEFQSFNVRATCCSPLCYDRQVRRTKRYEVQVPCPICQQTFWQNKYKFRPKTCSGLCGASYRKRREAGLQPTR